MNLYDATADSLRYGVMASMVMIVLGLAVGWAGHGDVVLWLGVLMLVLTPFFGIAVSLVCLIMERDAYWTKVTVILLSVVTAGIIISFLI